MGNGKINKKQSKRQSTKVRCKVEKKVREHARKLKKEKKKNPGKFLKSKKDPGVPNNCPFKDQVLAEAQEAIEKRNADKEKRRLELKEMRKTGKIKKITELRGQTLESLAAGAARRGKMFEGQENITARAQKEGCTDRSAKAYYRLNLFYPQLSLNKTCVFFQGVSQGCDCCRCCA